VVITHTCITIHSKKFFPNTSYSNANQKLFSSHLLPKTVNMLTFETIVFAVISQCCETLPRTLRGEHRLQVSAQKQEFKRGGKRPCGRPSSRWENLLSLALKTASEGANWILRTQDRASGRLLRTRQLYFRIHERQRFSRIPEELLTSEEELRSMELVRDTLMCWGHKLCRISNRLTDEERSYIFKQT
jgi:hypothetical protein